MKSIRTDIQRWLIIAMAAIALAGAILSLIIYSIVYTHQIDSELELRARLLSKTISRQGHGIRIGIDDSDLKRISDIGCDAVYQIWLSDGSVLAKSAKLGRENLPTSFSSIRPVFKNIVLKDIGSARYICLAITPRIALPSDSSLGEDYCSIPPEVSTAGPYVFLGLAQERQWYSSFMLLCIAIRFVMILVLLSLVVSWLSKCIDKSFIPFAELNDQLLQLNSLDLNQKIEIDNIPEELVPAVSALNKFTENIQKSFSREKRFVNDVAHELRTPVAELRLACEVGAQWSDDPVLVRKRFEELRQTSLSMESLVSSLLALRRAERDKVVLTEKTVYLYQFIDKCWGRLIQISNPLGLVLENTVDDSAVITTDDEKLEIILQNLFGNALSYASYESLVKVSLKDNNNGYCTLTISNEAPNMKKDDVTHIFERFWRGSKSSSDGSHSGLGMSIVKQLAEVLGTELSADLSDDETFSISIKFPPGLDPTVRVNRRV